MEVLVRDMAEGDWGEEGLDGGCGWAMCGLTWVSKRRGVSKTNHVLYLQMSVRFEITVVETLQSRCVALSGFSFTYKTDIPRHLFLCYAASYCL